MAAIYSFQNLTNGKRYVGQSIDPERRKDDHLRAARLGHKSSLLYSAIRKYGPENFTFEILEECEVEQLNELEQRWIGVFDSANKEKGYNMTNGGCQFGPMLEEHKRKIGEANKISKKGSKLSEEHKQKISESLKGHEGYWTGKSHDEESNKKRSDALKGRSKTPFSEDHKRRISESKKGSTPWNKGRKKGSL